MQTEPELDELRHVCFVGAEPPAGRDWRVRGKQAEGGDNRNPWQGSDLFRSEKRTELPASTAVEAESLDNFLRWLFTASGLDATAYRPQVLRRRVPACLRALRVSSTAAARVKLEREPELRPRAIDAILIGVSQFFRDAMVFEALRRLVLPELSKGRRGLRVLSAGCSEGQELYSMAMLLEESGQLQGSVLLGVDCRPQAVQRAQRGWFAVRELEEMRPEFRERYFQLHGTEASICPVLKAQLSWQVKDLLTFDQGGGWDVILFRNVAIYLGAGQGALWVRLAGQLSPGGVLVTGRAERPPSGTVLKRIAPCLYQRTA